MLHILNLFYLKFFLLLEQLGLVRVLAITVIFFLILLILGVRKSYKLKKENDRLNDLSTKFEDEENKPYKDFTEGHMYQQKKKD